MFEFHSLAVDSAVTNLVNTPAGPQCLDKPIRSPAVTDQIKCSHSITDRGCFFTSSHNNYVDTECFITLTLTPAYERDYDDELYGSLTNPVQ